MSSKAELFQAIQRHNLGSLDQLLAHKMCSPDARSRSGTPAIVKAIRYWALRKERRKRWGRHIICILLRHGATVDATDCCGRTAAIWAAFYGFLDCVKVLAGSGADLSLTDKYGYSALAVAVLKRRDKCVKYLQSKQQIHGFSTQSCVVPNCVVSLLRAIKDGECECVEKLLESRQCSPNTHAADGSPVLLYCIKQLRLRRSESSNNRLSSYLDILDTLLKSRADRNLRDRQGRTAAILASKYGLPEYLKHLKNAGADFCLTNNKGDNALMVAVSKGHTECVKYSLQHTSDLEHRNKEGDTALLLGEAHYVRREIMNLLLDAGCDVDAKDRGGKTVLMMAIANHRLGHIVLYIERGANVNVAWSSGVTPLIWAARLGSDILINDLLQRGARIDDRDKDGYTALMYAVKFRHKATIRILEGAGASINVAGKDHRSPLGLAFDNYFNRLVVHAHSGRVGEHREYQNLLALLDAGAYLTLKEQRKFSWTSMGRHHFLIQKMITNGFSPVMVQQRISSKNDNPCSFLQVALVKGYPEIVRYLIANRFFSWDDLTFLTAAGFENSSRTNGCSPDAENDNDTRETYHLLTKKPFTLMTISFVAVSSMLVPFDEAMIDNDDDDDDDDMPMLLSIGNVAANDDDGDDDDDCDEYSDGDGEHDQAMNNDVGDNGEDPHRREAVFNKTVFNSILDARNNDGDGDEYVGGCDDDDDDDDDNNEDDEEDYYDDDDSQYDERCGEEDADIIHVEEERMEAVREDEAEGNNSSLTQFRTLTREEKVGLLEIPQFLKDALLFRLPSGYAEPTQWNYLPLDEL